MRKVHATLSLAAAVVLGILIISALYAYRPADAAATDFITFRYQAPAGANAYTQVKVENTANWVPADESCSIAQDQEVPCSIVVPAENSMHGGSQIDPSKVTIYTLPSPIGNNNVLLDANPNGEYSDEVNKPLP